MTLGTEQGSIHESLGLTTEEYERICAILGREPNHPELAMFSVMWSEHCSYKSSRIHLSKLPSQGPRVLIGPGEGAGVIRVGSVAVALRLESHNHPSFVEPVQGAATGIGGIVRDVLSMGARPIALLDPLRFGPLPSEGRVAKATAEKNRFLVEGVVSGISSYGNSIGVPTVGGEVKFEDSYSGNPLVNVMCIGVAPADRIMLARAHGPGNKVLLVGSRTGRDGIGGVSVLASATFEEGDEDKRPSVQVGDPLTEKVVIEACLELIERGMVVGIQDLGGAGLCCATSESAAKAETGMRIDLERVPRREQGMEPFEVLTSESQERMLVVVEPHQADAAVRLCERLGASAAVIGEVTSTGELEVFENGELVAHVPARSLGDGPVYDRPSRRPKDQDEIQRMVIPSGPPEEITRTFLDLVGSPNIASKRWVWEQYDHQVMLGTVVKPGHDAAVIRIPGADEKIAVTTDGNGRYCYIDPYEGARHTVAEAYRNLSAVGAEPVAITNCLNMGSPERPEVMWQFIEVVKGMSDACSDLQTPVTGGNVSFYNETSEVAIYPTPIVGMVGVMPRELTPALSGFPEDGLAIVLLGSTSPELGGSEYARTILGLTGGALPQLDLAAEKALGSVLRLSIRRGVVRSAHDVSEGGIAIALAESCVSGGRGAVVAPEASIEPHIWLFSESASRAIVSVDPARLPDLNDLASAAGVPMVVIGETGGDGLVVEGVMEVPSDVLAQRYFSGFERSLGYTTDTLETP